MFGVFEKANSQVTAAEVKDILKATQQRLTAAERTTQWGGAPDAMSAILVCGTKHGKAVTSGTLVF